MGWSDETHPGRELVPTTGTLPEDRCRTEGPKDNPPTVEMRGLGLCTESEGSEEIRRVCEGLRESNSW